VHGGSRGTSESDETDGDHDGGKRQVDGRSDVWEWVVVVFSASRRIRKVVNISLVVVASITIVELN
jgi:hypothetical protein